MASSGCGAAGALTAAAAPQLSWRNRGTALVATAAMLLVAVAACADDGNGSSPVEWCSAAISFVMGQAVSAGS